MAELHFTLNQEEILQVFSENRSEGFRALFEAAVNSVLKAESAEQLKAERYERSGDREDYRNGVRERTLKTRIGAITLQVPRHRNVPFKTLVFDNYGRSESALIATMAEMVVNGVSTRKISTVMETLCETSFSKSTVSEVCKDLDEDVKAYRERPIEGVYPFLMVDATYFKVRENHRIVSKALMIALATNDEGRREIIGFGLYDKESKENWADFLESLKGRGLKSVEMVTSDAHEGIQYAVGKVFPKAPWQRCQTHFSRNVMDAAPKQYAKAIHASLLDMYNSATVEEARKVRDEIIEEYRDVAEKAIKILDDGFESTMTVMAIPKSMRRFFRTSNHLERLNLELKRRSKVVNVFPNSDSALRLMGSVLIEQNEKLTGKVNFSKEDAAKLPACKEALAFIAEEQQKLLAA